MTGQPLIPQDANNQTLACLGVQGVKAEDRWRRPLREGERVVLGRAPDAWQIPWERFLSAEHVELIWQAGRLKGRKLPGGRNPIYLAGRPVEEFVLRPGDHFVVGETIVTLTEVGATIVAVTEDEKRSFEQAPEPLQMRAFAAEELQRIRFGDAPHKLDVLTRLPSVISGATSDTDLFVRLVDMLLTGIARADIVGLIEVADQAPLETPVRIFHWDRRRSAGGEFRPSQRLVHEAVCRRQQSVLQVWLADSAPGGGGEYTQQADLDWAFCTPIQGDACRGWGIYVAGRHSTGQMTPLVDSGEMQAELKFTELVAAILRSLRQVQRLEQRQASLGHFFSPAVIQALGGNDPEVALKPRQTTVTVLFCDLRGFSRTSEQQADDLLALLTTVSKALGVMTENIFNHGGVIADFQGDAAMGFWGWPIAQPDAVRRACLAALCIRTEFESACRRQGHPLEGFQVGIGIATGPAVAGKIGVHSQAKVGVFGPVVNLASRLEGMTKLLGAAILMDPPTAKAATEQIQPGAARCRRLAVVTPVGLDTPVTVSELLPPVSEYPVLTDDHLRHYEAALDAFAAGQWSQALDFLQRVPTEDTAKDFLVEFILRHRRVPPANWKGIIPLDRKA
jgi:adenylate cyclase